MCIRDSYNRHRQTKTEAAAMAGFKDIVGNEQIIEHLQNAISMGKVSHAYIINGPQLSGKMMIAEAFARALQCEKEGTDGCGECKSCHQADDHNHPDIIYVSHEKPNNISVDDIKMCIRDRWYGLIQNYLSRRQRYQLMNETAVICSR